MKGRTDLLQFIVQEDPPIIAEEAQQKKPESDWSPRILGWEAEGKWEAEKSYKILKPAPSLTSSSEIPLTKGSATFQTSANSRGPSVETQGSVGDISLPNHNHVTSKPQPCP